MSSKKLRIVQKGYEGYNGPIGMYEFIDGVSTEAIPQVNRDRLAAAFEMVEIDAEGVEQPSGLAHRLVAEAAHRAPVVEQSQRATAQDKLQELTADLLKAAELKEHRIYTRDELEAIADQHGIKGLRDVAEVWGVKHRTLIVLLQMILDAQVAYLEQRAEVLKRKLAIMPQLAGEEAQLLKDVVAEAAEQVEAAPADEILFEGEIISTADAQALAALQNAALTGSFAAALNAPKTEGE